MTEIDARQARLRELTGLADGYRLDASPVLLSGLQALVRLLLLQSARDRRHGLRTAGFVSGYRGSPLGGLDNELWRAQDLLDAAQIRFEPGLNEELAATAIWGSQQANLFPGARFDGVFGMWYGKGPGVDRASDALKHGNSAGTSRYGGVLVAAGDDHACKSSTLAQQSEFAFMDAMMPVLNPSNVGELISLGLQGYALSRYSGCWIGFIVTQETADATETVDRTPDEGCIAEPTIALPPDGLHIRWPDTPLAQEHRLHTQKLEAAIAFARSNNLNRIVWDSPRPRFGIVTTGKAHGDLMQALALLRIDAERAAQIGIRILKVGMSWPLEPVGVEEFAAGLEEIIVVEEKRAVIETQIKELLYGYGTAPRPMVVGKRDEHGVTLLPSTGELTAGLVAGIIARRVARFDAGHDITDRASVLAARELASREILANNPNRLPHYCSGCPHNTSTRVPEGSRAIAGIGCHFMALWMGRDTATFTQMGGEGAAWIGQAPFVSSDHVFQNLGDGTYTHSGSLAIRAAVAARVNITFKILYNDAVAMTGGQPVEGGFTPEQIAQQLLAEGVGRVVIVTDHPGKYAGRGRVPAAVNVFGRDEFDHVQRQLREFRGVSALIYDQACAAELRRKRKRGLLPTPQRRVVINELVCEGCGDCNVQSNCLSVLPLETEFGRKRTIDQSACNGDYTCLKGFCPSFVTLRGAQPRRPTLDLPSELPAPTSMRLSSVRNVLIAGVGGTGVVTMGKLLGLAAHLEGKAVAELAQTGLAQKFGAVLSHVRIASTAAELIGSGSIAEGEADVLLGCDLMVAASAPSMTRLAADRSTVVVNSHHGLPPAFVHNPDLEFPGQALLASLGAASRRDEMTILDATGLASGLLGDAMLATTFLLGFALQRGLLPVSAAALDRALELFGSNVEANRKALAFGRYAAIDQAAVEAMAQMRRPARVPIGNVDELIAHRREFLVNYQDAAYGERYVSWISRIREKEASVAPGSMKLTKSVARDYFKLLAYKDEYEVARLYTDTGFLERLDADFGKHCKMTVHLAPPFLRRVDPVTGRPRKREFGPWVLRVFRLLAPLRVLRGSWLDPFGYSKERRAERALITEYETLLAMLIDELDVPRFQLALELTRLPEEIRGFGPIKLAAIAATAAKRADLLAQWRRSAREGCAAATRTVALS